MKPSGPARATDLKSLELLGALPDAVLGELAIRGHMANYATGEVIFRRGDAGDFLLLLTRGRVKIVNTTANAREIVLNFLGPGDALGEIAALDGGARSADAVAAEPTSAFLLARRDVLAVIGQQPECLLALLTRLGGKLRAASEVAEERLLSMAGRCAAGLLRLADQHRANAKDGTLIDLTVPQKDLGNYLGLSRENTSRQLGLLKEQGVIRLAGGRIVILDREALQEMARAEE